MAQTDTDTRPLAPHSFDRQAVPLNQVNTVVSTSLLSHGGSLFLPPHRRFRSTPFHQLGPIGASTGNGMDVHTLAGQATRSTAKIHSDSLNSALILHTAQIPHRN